MDVLYCTDSMVPNNYLPVPAWQGIFNGLHPAPHWHLHPPLAKRRKIQLPSLLLVGTHVFVLGRGGSSFVRTNELHRAKAWPVRRQQLSLLTCSGQHWIASSTYQLPCLLPSLPLRGSEGRLARSKRAGICSICSTTLPGGTRKLLRSRSVGQSTTTLLCLAT
ncbi:hypothetical protein HDV57DRAFT_183878 [Trichoderma longibrachiatum]|uniref:Uncharacterized protein n=1 Tax=Trichoderma longibrachiatum ATCC 18648 TaxID=983965 RepID=A0A2T4BZL7_TRILO|nr:hypothetical protein M440DRAFT_101014 [Trichoderma longibrachiatum ATCC 18648]